MQLFQPELGRRTCFEFLKTLDSVIESIREPSQESSLGVSQPVLGTVDRHRATHGRSQLHDTFARRVPEIQHGRVAWLSFAADAR